MPYISEEIPIEQLELNIEVTHHPRLINALNEIRDASGGKYDFAMMLGGIAAYCEVIMDDYYSPDEINNICTILTRKLRDKRMGGELVWH